MIKNNNYISDITLFLNDISDSSIKTKQQLLRHTWWDQNSEDVSNIQILQVDDLSYPAYKYF